MTRPDVVTTSTGHPAALHIRPSRGWINDPNGIVYRDGRWHVFFQHNPQAPVHDSICWGHVSSPDLVHWTEHPVAFAPTPGGPDRGGCWSGVFADGLDRPAVVYTGVTQGERDTTVCLRWGGEDLIDWGPPEVVAREPRDRRVRLMRDPFLFRHGGRRWALVGAGLSGGEPAVLVFGCDDIRAWTFHGLFAAGGQDVLADHAAADVWECPQLVRVDGTDVLILSLMDRGRFGDVRAVVGSVVADADGVPRFAARVGAPLDRGAAFYAPQVHQPEGGAAVLIGWVREEDGRPTDRDGVAGCLTFARRLALDGDTVVSTPAATPALVTTAPAVQHTGPGTHRIPDPAHVTVAAPARLTRGAAEVALAAGDMAWVDGDVLEVYADPPGVPRTERLRGAEWTLDLPAGTQATVTGVVPSTPA